MTRLPTCKLSPIDFGPRCDVLLVIPIDMHGQPGGGAVWSGQIRAGEKMPARNWGFCGTLLDKEHPDTLTWLHRLHISPRKEPTLVGTRMNAIVDRGYLERTKYSRVLQALRESRDYTNTDHISAESTSRSCYNSLSFKQLLIQFLHPKSNPYICN